MTDRAKKIRELGNGTELTVLAAGDCFIVDDVSANTTKFTSLSTITNYIASETFSAITQDLLPAEGNTYNLGSLSLPWKSLYVTSNTIYLSGTPLSVVDGTLTVDGNSINPFDETGSLVFPNYLYSAGSIKSTPQVGYVPSIQERGKLTLTPPDITVSSQCLVIYPTVINDPEATHLHLASGDLNVTDLFLGNDDKFVKVGADGNVCIGTANSNIWQFGENGNIAFPDSSIQTTAFTGVNTTKMWLQTFETVDPETDFVSISSSTEYDKDGNIIALFIHSVAGDTSEYTSLAKISPTGTILWSTRFSVSTYTDGWCLAYDGATDVIYVAGRLTGYPSAEYAVSSLTKINSVDGTLIWGNVYIFNSNASNSPVVDVAADGNPIIVGYATGANEAFITTTKVSSLDGSTIWSKSLDGQGNDEAYGMAVGSGGETVTVGYMTQLGVLNYIASGTDIYADPASNVLWTTNQTISVSNLTFDVSFTDGIPTFSNLVDTVGGWSYPGQTIATIPGSQLGGVDGVDDMAIKVDYITAGEPDDRMVVVKYNASGVIQWQKAVQFDAGYDCVGSDADIDADGNIYVCGQYQYTSNTGNTSAMSLVKFNSDGVKQWSRRAIGSCETFATSVVVGDDGYVYVSAVTGDVGTSDFICAVVKYDTNGSVVWQQLLDNTTTWTFGGTFFFGYGGSNISVKNGYIALAGGYGLPWTKLTAVVTQINTNGANFSVGDWDFKPASFGASFDPTASDITVVDAQKTDTDFSGNLVVQYVEPGIEYGGFLVGTIYNYGVPSQDRLISGNTRVVLGSNGQLKLPGATIHSTIAVNTAIDLTKSVNKLIDGSYTLADGVEGQMLYLVPQNGVTSSNVAVNVSNFRNAGSQNSNGYLLPFRTYVGGTDILNTDMCTLIFTDTAWQISGGSWD